MSTTLVLRLPWGKYHATPWGRNVNEAAVEWPPSSWRLLRALYSTWKNRCPDLTDDEVLPVLAALSDPPRYSLPDFTVAHTRHYLPGIGHYEGRKTEAAKTLDTFVVTARGAELFVEWAADLEEAGRAVLGRLAEELAYLGRAETVVEGRLGPHFNQRARDWIDPIAGDSPTLATTRVLVPEKPLDIEALTRSPHQVRTDRRLVPPSTRWVSYPSPVEALPVARVLRRVLAKPTAVRFAVSGRPLPPKYAAVALGDVARRTVMSRFGRQNDDGVSVTLSGKDEGAHPLEGLHTHAHYLSHSAKGRGIDTFVLWAPGGLDERDLLAAATKMEFRLRRDLEHVDGVQERRLGVESFGAIEVVAPELVGPSQIWVSHTPYAPARHWKGSLEEQLLQDITSELLFRHLPAPLTVEVLRGDWLHYRRYRLRENINQARRAYGARIVFDEPLVGPLCLGQLSHYGLGLFVPDSDD